MTLDAAIIIILALIGLLRVWFERREIARERAETFERIRRGRMAF